MAEEINQPREPKVARVYVGEGKHSSKPIEQKKPDTEYNRRMQEVFDIVSREALAEREDARNTQTELALLTASTLTKKNSITELDEKIRGRAVPRKLERILMFTVLGGVSALLDFAGDELTRRWLPKDGKGLLNKANGNREALKAGWEFITDALIGKFSDISVEQATNRKDVRFVSPLSDTLAKVGNIAMTLAIPGDKKKGMQRFINSLINPSTVEAGIRALATVPVGGAVVENMYVAANKYLLKDHGVFPFGFDLGVSMLAAKAKYRKYTI